MKYIRSFVKKNTVLAIAILAALATSFIIRPDSLYLGYFDYKTLTCLFCVLAVVCALKNLNFFYILAKQVVRTFKNVRMCTLALVYVTFIGSMLIANDMALLTFLPLGFLVLTTTHQEKYMAFVFIMQNIAANLGGMVTPFGNPQNLYLYTKFNIPTGEFVLIMLPLFILSVVLITLCCIFLMPGDPMELPKEKVEFNVPRTVICFILFAFSIIIVFRIIPFWWGLIVVPSALLILDRKALKMVDYPLLLTFVSFFIFAGNMARIDAVRDFFSFLLSKSTLLFSILSCQCISNVPSAILLSQFTSDYADLLRGVNIGGVGTLIASLASLITFREYTKHNPGKAGYYIGKFSLYNFGFLIILTVFSLLTGAAAASF